MAALLPDFPSLASFQPLMSLGAAMDVVSGLRGPSRPPSGDTEPVMGVSTPISVMDVENLTGGEGDDTVDHVDPHQPTILADNLPPIDPSANLEPDKLDPFDPTANWETALRVGGQRRRERKKRKRDSPGKTRSFLDSEGDSTGSPDDLSDVDSQAGTVVTLTAGQLTG